ARRSLTAHTGRRHTATGRAVARRHIVAEPRHSPAEAAAAGALRIAAAGPRSDAAGAPAPASARTPARRRIPAPQAAEEVAAAFRGARAASMPAGSEEHPAVLPADHTAVD